jgi:hypothetical protein
MARRRRDERSEVVNKRGSEETDEPSCLEQTKPHRICDGDSMGGNKEARYIDLSDYDRRGDSFLNNLRNDGQIPMVHAKNARQFNPQVYQ